MNIIQDFFIELTWDSIIKTGYESLYFFFLPGLR
jgi:hypothetical protein